MRPTPPGRRRCRSAGTRQERLPDRSCGALDRCTRRAGVLRLLHQLPHRSGRRDHRGCGGDTRASNHEGRVDQDHGRMCRAALRLVGDTAYGTAPMLGWMVKDKGIAPHVPVWYRTERKDGTLSSNEFVWNEYANEYRCPQGHALLSERRVFTRPRESRHQGRDDHLPGQPARLHWMPDLRRSVHEDSRDVARELGTTRGYLQSRSDRKKVEILVAHLKRVLKLDPLRVRGLSGAHDEFLLAATAQNLRRRPRG